MFKLLLPRLYLSSAYALPIDDLIRNGIKVLICDVDNSLLPHHQLYMNDKMRNFLSLLKQAGIQVVFASNNTMKRLQFIAEETGLETHSFSCKPFPFVFNKIKKKYGITGHEIAIMGDQLFTDILGGNLQGSLTILCEPLEKKDLFYTIPFRVVESLVFYIFEKKGYMKKGEYHETM